MLIHTVKAGDTLFSISQQYGVPLFYISESNGLTDAAKLAVGQSIAVPFPLIIHSVIAGDTLYKLASDYGTTINELYKNNLVLKGKPEIYAGQKLVIKVDKTPIGKYQIGGYSYPFISDDLLNTTLPFMNYLMPFTYGFNTDGTLVPLDDNRLIARAHKYQTNPIMHLSSYTSEGTFSTENAEYLLHNKQLWNILCTNIVDTIYEKNYSGLDIDFEFLGKKNALAYAEFVLYMRKELNQNGYPVIVALAPKTSDMQPGLLYEGHDYALIGAAANAVLIMTYEWGYTFGPPLAVSPIPNIKKVLEYAVTRINPSKIFEGISNYGYDFTLPYVAGESRATSLSTLQATNLAIETGSTIEYDEVASAPYFYYTKNEKKHVVWFEDARSIRAKLLLFKEFSLKGGLYWNLNRENAQNLTVLNCYITRGESSLFS
ncbi:MAG: LysM peptidoglycan-binding domain-containing protein [Clostridia bacterium]